MSIFGAAVGTLVGMLLAGALRKMFPVLDVTVILAGIVAAGCFVGIALEWHSDFRSKNK
jgi:hypothetical protein